MKWVLFYLLGCADYFFPKSFGDIFIYLTFEKHAFQFPNWANSRIDYYCLISTLCDVITSIYQGVFMFVVVTICQTLFLPGILGWYPEFFRGFSGEVREKNWISRIEVGREGRSHEIYAHFNPIQAQGSNPGNCRAH